MTTPTVVPGPWRPRRDAASADELRTLGLTVLLVSLGVLFTASMVGVLIVRFRADSWPSYGLSFPAGLWVSTVLIVLSSLALVRAERTARSAGADATAGAHGSLVAASALGVVFLLCQGVNWLGLAGPVDTLLLFATWVLTVLHAVHVLGGLVPLLLVTVRARQGRATPTGVVLVARYWHFLASTWVAILVVLAI